MARAGALAAALAVALLAVPGAGAALGADAPRRGGTVVLTGGAREPACLNAFFERCRSADVAATSWVMGAVLPGAFRVGPGLELQPNLVSHVDIKRTPPFALTYHIRPEAHWSDGTPVSARDFVFTHRTSLSAGVKLHDAEAVAQIAGVRPLDARTVRVVLRSRFGGWRRLFPYVLPEHVLAGADFSTVWNERIHDPRTGRPIGSGPWLVRGWERGRALTFERNPRYWRGRPAYLDRVVLRFRMGNEEAIEGLRRGELDLAHAILFSVDETREVRQLDGVRVHSEVGPGWDHLQFRFRSPGHPALGDKRVRRAIAQAIDRAALVRAQVPAADRRNGASDSAVFWPTSRHYQPNWSGLRYDRAESARLLRQAGCRPGADGIYVCVGERLSLRGVAIAGNATHVEALRIISEQLRRAGIEVVPSFASLGHLFGPDGIVPSGAFDLVYFALVRGSDEPGMNQILRCGGVQNHTGYCQRLVDRDLDEAGKILDVDRRARVLNRIDARVANDVPLLPLFHRTVVSAASARLRGYVLGPSGPLDPFIGAENWWLAR